MRRRTLSRLSWLMAPLAAASLLALGTGPAAQASAPTGPVSKPPATGTPHLPTSTGSTEQIRQLVQCGPTMYAVGSFTSIVKGSTTYGRNNAFSFLATAPYTVTSWNPNVNGVVNSIGFNGTDCSHAYLGGAFSSVGGTSRSNIAEVDTTSGAVVPGFTASANKQVETLLGWNGHLLTGGYFTVIDGSSAHEYFASLNPTSGADDGYLSLAISGNYQYTDDGGNNVSGNPTRVYNLQLSNSGNKLLVEGDFTSFGGQPRRQIAMLDLGATTATTDGWYPTEFNQNCATVEPFYAQAAAWSPDDSTIYVGTTGYKPANGPGYNTGSPRAGLCDVAAAFPSTATVVTHLWINYAGCDSIYAAAADASTAYFAGHERWASNPLGCDGAGPGAVSAPGIVGLSPKTGSVTFNPTRGRGLGADDMLVTGAGLWIASDNLDGTNMCGGVSGYAGICLLPYASHATAAFTANCSGLSCSFNAGGSTDPGGSITKYAWTWGDGGSDQTTSAMDSHAYTSSGTDTVTLTVTGSDGTTNSTSQTVHPSSGTTSPVTFGGVSTYDGNASTAAVTVPAAAKAGDALLLFDSYASTTVTATPPAGWTQVGTTSHSNLTTAVYERSATSGDPGSQVSVGYSATVKSSLTLADYASAASAVEMEASATDTATNSHKTPTVNGLSSGSLAVSFWTDKSTGTTSWTPPSGVTKRADVYGTGGGAVSALLADSGSSVSGSYGGLTATTNATSGSAAEWTIALASN